MLPLPQLALDIIEDQRRANPESPFVFAASRSTLARAKKAFETAHPRPQWQLHDLRRSSRSLMAAAGVPSSCRISAGSSATRRRARFTTGTIT